MIIGKKLDKALTESLLSESRRLRPAKILTARGVVIEADHARIIQHPRTGTRILIMGIGREDITKPVTRWQNIGKHKNSLTGRMRDFTAPGEYVPAPTHPYMVQRIQELNLDIPWQDESGWSHANSQGKYSAHRAYEARRKFRKILTAFVDNIKSIKWLDQ